MVKLEPKTFCGVRQRWLAGDAWPPKDASNRSLYLSTDNTASLSPPVGPDQDSFDSYVSDPAHPAPYRQGVILPTYGAGSSWYSWLIDDQRALSGRPDVLTWKTSALTEDLRISGDVLADLYASTSGTDSDWVVKLIDVYPDDYQGDPRLAVNEIIVSDEVFRGRFRKSFEHPEALPSNEVLEYKIDLHSADHVFLKGHRIAVQIQSAWFPLIDRNPQRFVPNIFEAKPADYQSATQRVFRSAQHPTHIVLPVKPVAPEPAATSD